MPITRSVGKERRDSTETKPSSSDATTGTSATGTTETSATGTTATDTTGGTSATDTSVTTKGTVASVATGTTMARPAATIFKNSVELTASTDSPTVIQKPSEAHSQHGSRAPSRRAGSTRSRSKAYKVAKAKEELIRLQVELATARLAVIEAEDDDDDVSEYSKTEADTRVDDWLEQQAQPRLAIADEPHLPLREIETEIEAITEETRPVQQNNSTAHHTQPDPRVHTTAGAQAPAGVHAQPDFSQLTSAITQAIKASQRSSKFVELPTFNGNYQDWLPFRAAYMETEESFSIVENINRLRRHLIGRAKEAVESLLITNAHPSDVMKTLEMRFGRSEMIAMAEIDTLRTLPRLCESPRDICVFSTKVTNAVSTLRALKCVYYLYNPEVSKVMVDKLTPTLRYRYYDFAATQPKEEPDLLKFEKFMKREAELCGPYALPEQMAPPMYSNRRPQKTHTVLEKQSTVIQKCPVCEETGHIATDCKQFKEANESTRWDIAKKKRLCFRCLRFRNKTHNCRTKPCGINSCKYFHNRLLHFNRTEKAETEDRSTEVINSAWTTARPTKKQTFLKIIPVQATGPKNTVNTYALLDDGSTVTLIDDSLAYEIGAKGPIDPLRIEAINELKTAETKSRRVSITLNGLNNHTASIQARTIKNLHVSPQEIARQQIEECEHLRDLSDVLSYEDAKPTILIGQDNWHLLLASRVRRGKKNQPVASLTPLGWVLHGSHNRIIGRTANFVSHITEAPQEDKLEDLMKHYFAMDSLCINPKKPQSDPEEQALRILQKNTTQTEEGRYETALLWKREEVDLPNNYDNSLTRLMHIEKKLDRNSQLKQKYTEQMDALIKKGYAEPAPRTKTPNRTWYLPHFAVVNPMKPDKLRVVHDAAAKTKGVALNDLLLKGPDLLQSLPGVVMKFRQHMVAVTADIKEMFMQVKLRTEDRDALRYLWRGNRRDDQPPEEYRMTSLIFGASSSPSTAIFVKNLNAKKYEETEPEAASAIIEKHYVDDYLDSFRSLEEAIRITSSVRDIHRRACFELKQWKSNTPALLRALGEQESSQDIELYKAGEQLERVLGIVWKPDTDELTFNLNLTRVPRELIDGKTPTKREALRIVMSLFDPLGFASPVTIRAKQILQELWRRGTSWDEKIEDHIAEQWRDWMVHLRSLSNIAIPRRYLQYSDATSLQLHVFTDASESAYAAVLYWRATAPNGDVSTSLIMSKAKVAPLKLTSIPRLELQAAVMGTRLADAVVKEHQRKPDSRTFWTDSRTVLSWIKAGSRSYKSYVAHRIAAIEEGTKVSEWRWVPTKSNVADDATRNVPIGFNKNHRWYRGPDFLHEDSSTWPIENSASYPSEPTGEERTHNIVTERGLKLAEGLPEVSRFSNWDRLRFTTARVLQFIQLCRTSKQRVNYKRTRRNAQADPDWRRQKKTPVAPQVKHRKIEQAKCYISVPAELLREAEELLMRSSQESSFQVDIDNMKRQKPIDRDSRLHRLSVKYENGALRLRSRIEAIEAVTNEVKNPMVLDGDHPTVKLWIHSIHRQMHHSGVEATVNECRQRYWVLRLRPVTRTIIRQCLRCRMKTQAPPYPRTGDLPSCRLAHHKRPFTYTGVDYFGPLTVTVGRTNQKRYVAIFTCLTTRAIHLEVTASLTTDSAVMALRRMMARRGRPAQIWSDNGTNLRGADKELRQAIDAATAEEAAKKIISWRFIPPGAPFMGGAWERLVRSVKTALQATLHERHPAEEVLTTLLAEVEYTVNSRPLTHVSVSAEDPEALTPNHFLLGGNGRVSTPGEFNDRDTICKNSWRAAQRLTDIFWTRWLREYLPELQHRREPHGRGATVKIGDLVQILDSNLPRNIWVRGRVIATFPGPDNIVRTVDVATKGGVLRRPVRKLVVLPIEDVAPAPTEDATQLHGGRNVRDDANS
ncbi:uncharacterized protein [Epargyreus clarus]|uniref:uncharacterized protein n=1 Tax=Epargyreus clarus TaxID=520877 RepID=UPI003C30DCF5